MSGVCYAVDGLKVVHLLYEPGTKVLKQVLENQLHLSFFKENEKEINSKLKASAIRKIYPLEKRNEESILQTLDLDSLKTLLQLIGIPYSDRYDATTVQTLITVTLLQNHLSQKERNLKALNKKKNLLCTTQWRNMFPLTHEKWKNSFDTTLLCFILFGTFNLQTTSNTKNAPPAESDTKLGDDVERIRYYRNIVIHGNFLEKKDFSLEWNSICGAIIRLGGPRYREIIEEVQCKSLDPYLKQSYEELIKECQLQEAIRCKTVEKLETNIEDAKYDINAKVDTAATKVQVVVEYEAQGVKNEVREVESKIREKINEKVSELKKVTEEHQKEYSIKISSTLQTATETIDKAFQKYRKLVAEKVKQTRQTGTNQEEGLLSILRSVKEEIKQIIQVQMEKITDNLMSDESDTLKTAINDVHSLVQKMNEYVETNRAVEHGIGENVTTKLSQGVCEQCDQVAQKPDTLDKNRRDDLRESSVNEQQLQARLYKMTRDFVSLVSDMTRANRDIKSIMFDVMDTQADVKGVGKQSEEVLQKLKMFEETHKEDMRDLSEHDKQMKDNMDELSRDFQSWGSDMTTTCRDIQSMKDAVEDMQTVMREVGAKAEAVHQNLESFEKTRREDMSDSSAHRQMQEYRYIDQIHRECQRLASEITTASRDINSIKVHMKDDHTKISEDDAQILETHRETHDKYCHEMLENDKQLKQHIHQMTREFQGLVREMTTIRADINSIKDDMKDTQPNFRGVEGPYADVSQAVKTLGTTLKKDNRELRAKSKQLREYIDQMTTEFQGLVREMTTISADIKSIKNDMKDTQPNVRGAPKVDLAKLGEFLSTELLKNVTKVKPCLKDMMKDLGYTSPENTIDEAWNDNPRNIKKTVHHIVITLVLKGNRQPDFDCIVNRSLNKHGYMMAACGFKSLYASYLFTSTAGGENLVYHV